MNVLLIGSGGREHAIAFAISKSQLLAKLYALPGNTGINKLGESIDIDLKNFDAISSFCVENGINLVIIGPEQPLADGLSDYLRERNINVFGPSQYCAQLESSKSFAKDFMHRYGIPTAAYKVFELNERSKAIENLNSCDYPVVIKADGLAAGKGVVIAANADEAIKTLNSFFDGQLNDAGRKIVLEEFMDGEEASILAVTDGKDFITLAPAQDHKRIFDGDKGPNTGGMGAYAPAPVVNDIVLQKVNDKIIRPVLENLSRSGHPFIGCLYAGLMIKDSEPKVVEFNVRFGDPETQVVLPLIDGDFLGLIHSAAEGHLDKSTIVNSVSGAACCVVLASEGYPGKFEKGFEILGLDTSEEDILIYHAGTKTNENKILSNGGRVLGVCGISDTLVNAVKKAYSGVSKIHFDNMFYRKDIAHRALDK